MCGCMITGLGGRGSIWKGGGIVWIGMLWRGTGSLMRLGEGGVGGWGWRQGRGAILGLGGDDVEGKMKVYDRGGAWQLSV